MTEFGDLRAHQQASLRAWRANYLGTDQLQVGLWVCGKRRSGSSTVGDIALSQAVHADGMGWECMTADEIVNLVRDQWSAGTARRGNPSDIDLVAASFDIDASVDGIMSCGVLMVDDLHSHSTDMSFWNRHVEKRITQRVKDRKPTIVATDMTPNHPALVDFQEVIEDLFVICHAER